MALILIKKRRVFKLISEYEGRYPVNEINIPPDFLPQLPFHQGYDRVWDEIRGCFPGTQER